MFDIPHTPVPTDDPRPAPSRRAENPRFSRMVNANHSKAPVSVRHVIDRDESIALAEAAQDGDRAAMARLIETHLPYLLSLARRHHHLALDRRSIDDVLLDGVVAFQDAIARWDRSRGVPPGYFASHAAQGAMRRSAMIAPYPFETETQGFFSTCTHVTAILSHYARTTGRRSVTTEAEAAEAIALARESGMELPQSVTAPMLRHVVTVAEARHTLSLSGLDIVDESARPADSRVMRAELVRDLRRSVADVLRGESDRNRTIFLALAFPQSGIRPSFESIGTPYGITPERVGQIFRKLLGRVREEMLDRGYGDGVDFAVFE